MVRVAAVVASGQASAQLRLFHSSKMHLDPPSDSRVSPLSSGSGLGGTQQRKLDKEEISAVMTQAKLAQGSHFPSVSKCGPFVVGQRMGDTDELSSFRASLGCSVLILIISYVFGFIIPFEIEKSKLKTKIKEFYIEAHSKLDELEAERTKFFIEAHSKLYELEAERTKFFRREPGA